MDKFLIYIIGAILTLFGLFGFTSNPLVGHNSLFATNSSYNIIHIIFGLIILIVAFWFKRKGVLWLKIIGSITFILGFIGLLSIPETGGKLLGFLYTNGSSNWMHFFGGIIIFIAAICSKNRKNQIIAQNQ